MAKISPDLIRIAARQVRLWGGGSGPNLFLLHGSLGDAEWHWHTVWEELGESFTVAAPDLPQFGSTVELPNPSFAELVEWVARVQELAGMSEASVIGHSFGAGLARFYAAAHPKRVSHLVLADGGTIPRPPGILKRIMRSNAFAPIAEMAGPQTFSVQTIRSAFVNQALVTPEVIKGAQEASHGFTTMVRRVVEGELPQRQNPRVRTMLIWGDKDRIAPKERAQEIAADFEVEELAVIKNTGHLPQIEDPLSFVKIVRDFFLDLPREPPAEPDAQPDAVEDTALDADERGNKQENPKSALSAKIRVQSVCLNI